MKHLARLVVALVFLRGAGAAAGWFDFPAPRPSIGPIAYGASRAQYLNLYLPAGKGPYPLVMVVHGGAFIFGGAGNFAPGFAKDAKALLASGIAIASLNYRLAPAAHFPAPVRDVNQALNFLAANAATYRLDPARFALWGKSAGANLVLLAGLGRHEADFAPDPGLRLAAIVAFYAPADFTAMDGQLRADQCPLVGRFLPHDGPDSPESAYLGVPIGQSPALVAAADPARYGSAAAPPVWLQAGTADCLVPFQQSVGLAGALRRAGTPVTLTLVPGGVHADLRFDRGASLRRVVGFLRAALHPAGRTAAAMPGAQPL